MKVLVSGAGGYIGIPLCNKLIKLGHEVVALDRYFFGKKPDSGAVCWVDDTRDLSSHDIADCGAEAVVDLAGLSNDASCEIDLSYTDSINRSGGKNLFNCAVGAGIKRRYVYSSSASVYGRGVKQGLTESDPPNPLTAYALSKLAVENYILKECAGKPGQPETVVLRNATVFGLSPRMRFDLALNAMTRRAWKDKVIYCMGGGNQVRPFVHVSDVVDAFVWALTAPADLVSGQIFNVGFDHQHMTIRQLAAKVAHFFPDAVIHDIPDDADERSYHLSFAKYVKASGNVDSVGLISGIAEIRDALADGLLDADDETAMTMPYYRSLIKWEKRLSEIRLNGRIL